MISAHTNQNLAVSNSTGVKTIFRKLYFCDGLVWMVGLTENKAAVLNSSSIVYTVLKVTLMLHQYFAL